MKKKTRLLFVHPGTNRATREIEKKNPMLGAKLDFVELSFAYLDAYIKEKLPGIETSYLDFRFEDATRIDRVLLDAKAKFDFTHVAMTCYSRHFLQVKEIARHLKNIDREIPVIVGGFHPTVHPVDFKAADVPVDCIIRGEGEIPLYQLLRDGNCLEGGTRTLCHDRPINLNKSPPFTLDIYSEYKDRLDLENLYVYFSRGCINECTFCAGREQTCNMKAYRFLSHAKMEEQLEILEHHDPASITIQDPIFGVNEAWCTKILDAIGARGREYRVSAEMHVDLASRPRLQAFARNRVHLTVGFESASPAMLLLMRKTRDPGTYLKRMETILHHFADKDETFTINILVLHPGETRQTLDQTFDFLKRNASMMHDSILKTSFFRLYPGTPVHDQLDALGKSHGTRAWCTDWWLHDIDHSTAPSLVDPSRGLGFIDGFDHVRARFADLVKFGILKSPNVTIQRKLASWKALSNMERTRENLLPHVQALLERFGATGGAKP